MKLLVIGGTRGLGRAVVLAAHAAGHTLTVMARDAARFDVPVTGLRVVPGDAGDANDVDRAVRDQEAVVWAVGVAPTRRAVHVFSRGTQFLLSAMTTHGVRRLVCVTAAGTGDSRGGRGFLHERVLRPLLHATTFADKARQEVQVAQSELDWTIVRPAAMTHGPATGRYRVLTGPGTGPHRRVARADVAAFVVASLGATEHVRRAVLVAGVG